MVSLFCLALSNPSTRYSPPRRGEQRPCGPGPRCGGPVRVGEGDVRGGRRHQQALGERERKRTPETRASSSPARLPHARPSANDASDRPNSRALGDGVGCKRACTRSAGRGGTPFAPHPIAGARFLSAPAHTPLARPPKQLTGATAARLSERAILTMWFCVWDSKERERVCVREAREGAPALLCPAAAAALPPIAAAAAAPCPPLALSGSLRRAAYNRNPEILLLFHYSDPLPASTLPTTAPSGAGYSRSPKDAAA